MTRGSGEVGKIFTRGWYCAHVCGSLSCIYLLCEDKFKSLKIRTDCCKQERFCLVLFRFRCSWQVSVLFSIQDNMAFHFECVFITGFLRVPVEAGIVYLLKRVNHLWLWYKHFLLYILLVEIEQQQFIVFTSILPCLHPHSLHRIHVSEPSWDKFSFFCYPFFLVFTISRSVFNCF